jgi:hypothetical protein
MTILQTYLVVALGIVISVVLPILRKLYPEPAAAAAGTTAGRLWAVANPYVVLGVGSLLTALLIVAFGGDSLTSWKAALLAGYAWDSTLQKIVKA